MDLYKRTKRTMLKEKQEDIVRLEEQYFQSKGIAKPKQTANQPEHSSTIDDDTSSTNALLLQDIQQNMLGITKNNKEKLATAPIIGDIVEKQVLSPKVAQHNFEKVGKSLFARNKEQTLKNSADVRAFGATSAIVQDSKLAKDVHDANMASIGSMKEQQILAEQAELLHTVDPAIVAFLQQKRKAKQQTKDEPKAVKDKPKQAAAAVEPVGVMPMELATDLSADNPANAILQQSSFGDWLHFDVVETSKLAWMNDIPLQAKNLKPGEQFEARFDWKGVLLPYSMLPNEQQQEYERELYLHGDEPHRPGYTLQELFRLARSTVLQQRVASFGAIKGILDIYNQGFYDQVLDLPLTRIFFLLRFGLDQDKLVEVVTAAMASLLYNQIDETILDYVFDNPKTFWQPILCLCQQTDDADDATSVENLQKQLEKIALKDETQQLKTAPLNAKLQDDDADDEENCTSDYELAEKDLVQCLLRTNILQRINYIFNQTNASVQTTTCCLKILMRIARSGNSFGFSIMQYEPLTQHILQNFLPDMHVLAHNDELAFQAYMSLRLLRILLMLDVRIAQQLQQQLYQKIKMILYYQSDLKGHMVRVQTEALRIVRALFLYERNEKLYSELESAFHFMLNWHMQHDVFGLTQGGSPLRQHAAALLSTFITQKVNRHMQQTLGKKLTAICSRCFYKAANLPLLKDFTQITLLNSAVATMKWLLNYAEEDQTGDFSKKYLKSFIASDCFKQLIKTLRSSSIIYRTGRDRRNQHAALPNAGTIIVEDHGPQILLPTCYPFMLISGIWEYAESEASFGRNETYAALSEATIVQILLAFVRLLPVKLNRYMATHFLANSELKFIFELLLLKDFRMLLTNAEIIELGYYCSCLLTKGTAQMGQKICDEILLNPQYIQLSAHILEQWQIAYKKMLCLQTNAQHLNNKALTMLNTQLPLLSMDWPYKPLEELLQKYINSKAKNLNLNLTEYQIVEMSFSFVCQLEATNANLEIVPPTVQLMYFMIAFLGSERVYLHAETNNFMTMHWKRFIAKYKDHTFDFETRYDDKSHFDDLYALFVHQYSFASFGNHLFGAVLMVPLAQKYDSKWRKRIWSDLADCLKFFQTDKSLLLGGMAAYMHPAETDETLLKDYENVLSSKNLISENSVLYKIANAHLVRHYWGIAVKAAENQQIGGGV